jgi:alpha-N-arabinofuranosidase
MAHQATVRVSPTEVRARIDRRLFGSFVEHMGRCVYTGVYEPDHPSADRDGFRTDVADLVRELGPTVLRYPGGNFVSSYKWEDGVGPREERPTRLDLAWRSIEPNQVGPDEFIPWARSVGAEPMMAVNLGTRGVHEAMDLLEYTNHPGGTHLSDLRAANGHKEPHDVRLWCLGNELDGPWQMGAKTAHEYGRLAHETAKAMRMVDPGIELVAVGSSNHQMPTFGSWERTVLEHTYDQVDHISLHAYYEEVDGDRASFLASAVDMDAFIDEVASIADQVGAASGSSKRLTLSFDEWNVWYQSRFVGQTNLDWTFAPHLIEDDYTAVDAVVVGSLMMSLLEHSDRVAIACQAQLVNVIAPIRTLPGGPAWRQSAFHPFALTARHARGHSLRTEVSGPRHATDRYDEVDALQVSATHDPETGEACLLLVHRGQDSALPVHVDLAGFGADVEVLEHVQLAGDGTTTNTPERPDAVTTTRVGATTVRDGALDLELPAASWSMVRLAVPSAPAGDPT